MVSIINLISRLKKAIFKKCRMLVKNFVITTQNLVSTFCSKFLSNIAFEGWLYLPVRSQIIFYKFCRILYSSRVNNICITLIINYLLPQWVNKYRRTRKEISVYCHLPFKNKFRFNKTNYFTTKNNFAILHLYPHLIIRYLLLVIFKLYCSLIYTKLLTITSN